MNLPNTKLKVVKDEASAGAAVETVIAEHPFVKGLKPEHIQTLSASAMRIHYAAGDLIFSEGDPANRFYLIESGNVVLESGQKEKAPVAIQTIGSGDVLGWSWLFPPYYWHFDARVVNPATVIFFYGTRLREQCEEDHDLGYELMKRMAGVVIQRLQAARRELLSHEEEHRDFFSAQRIGLNRALSSGGS